MNERNVLIAVLLLLIGATLASSSSAQEAAPPESYATVPPPPEAGPPPAQHEIIEGRARNTVFGEGLGAGLFYSINYERLVHEDVGVRVGFGLLGFEASTSAAA